MVLPWLDEPVMLHSSRKDTCKLTAAQCEYRHGHWRYWYQADHVYGHATIYFMCAVVALFTLVNISQRCLSRSKSQSLAKNPTLGRGLAALRFLSYKTFHIQSLGWYSPPLGIMVLGQCGAIYFLALTLGPQPYYWPNTKTLSYGGSPPLATRTGWMSLALLPFVMLTASKTNYITVLTGVSHERLQVFHRWISWTMFVLALIHTFPFIVVHIQQKHDMEMQWKMEVTYWTGVAALIPQAWLNIMSIGPIRNRYYEFFKSFHFIAIGAFIFFFFIHCDFRLTSWDYFIAALSLYGATLIYSFLRNAIQSLDAHATFHTLPDSTIRISIPSTMKWAPGQHVFLRFWAMGLNAYTTHPFTICSLPDSKEMVFYVRPQAGITARLKTLIGTRRGFMPMSIDGPYGDGGVSTRLAAHTSVVLIAGGSGAGVLFPLLEDLLKKAGSSSKLDVKVVIAVRHLDSAVWISDVLDGILAAKDPEHTVIVEIYVTDQPAPPSIDSSATTSSIPLGELESAEKPVSHTAASTSSGEKHASLIQGRGRPDLVALIEESTRTGGESGGDVGVVGCGPAGMLYDIQEACADAQKRVLQGAVGSRSVWLHVEAFSW